MSQVLNRELPSGANSPRWLSPTIDRLSELLTLPANWDSYGARPIDPKIALAAIRLLGRVMWNDSCPPSVVPTNRGGVQLEWHARGVDLEINVIARDEFHVSYESSSEAWERTLSSDLLPLAEVMANVSAENSSDVCA